MNYLIYNPLANNSTGEKGKDEALVSLHAKFSEIQCLSVITLEVAKFIKGLKKEDNVILFGGDGTLMRFVNAVDNKNLPCAFYFYKGGTGNDFLRDVEDKIVDSLVYLNDIIAVLPVIKVNGKEYKYLNGIGFGLDGMACEVADKKKAMGETKINYAGISIGLMLGGYKCPSAKVTVDGVVHEYKKVWLASAMNGKYYGGGMDIAPKQDRYSDKVTACIFHDSGKLKTLMIFPSIFKGQHVKNVKYFEMIEGKNIKVEFSHPCALQIDGETVLNVTSYEVSK